jgi:hypothetical protein
VVGLPLGGAFHSRRLRLRSSQVGTVSPARAATRTHADRLALALQLLADPVFDVLISGESSFADLPAVLTAMAGGTRHDLAHRITYAAETEGGEGAHV